MVQLVAVLMIVEREKEIQNFKPESSFRFTAEFKTKDGNKFKATLPKDFKTYEEAKSFIESCTGANLTIKNLQKKPAKRNPSAPFTTPTLQQDAPIKLGYSVSRTMRVPQQLYESGLITHIRT